TDFFLPIEDDPFLFGKIAAANALSDIYAMGGSPFLALAILGWPVNKLPTSEASKIMAGAAEICQEANVVLAGGHSIDTPEPIFGLAVSGKVSREMLMLNSNAKEGDILFLTKPLGVGILATAKKQKKMKLEHAHIAPDSMQKLNKIGQEIPAYVRAMTDVTGFGLLGHLIEMCEASDKSAEVYFHKVPIFPEAKEYWQQGCVPGGTKRNLASYGSKVYSEVEDDFCMQILADPQTSGGLLISIPEEKEQEFTTFLQENQLPNIAIGKILKKSEYVLFIRN
ncbi:MAG: selenide, water dikinase SelD, partial [Candidatus Hydrogenedentota bacterium]